MVIQKVINNNVISAYDENQQEVVIMGKGIGFKAHTGDAIDESRVEKVFRIENEKLSRQFQEILENIPLEHMQLTSDIITYAKKNLNVQLNQSIYITLTDHINFAIQRQVQGIQLKNALLWEIKKFYHQEYLRRCSRRPRAACAVIISATVFLREVERANGKPDNRQDRGIRIRRHDHSGSGGLCRH